MHIIVRSCLNNFKDVHSLNADDSKSFELFVNYLSYSQHCVDHIDVEDLFVPDPEPGIDGAMIFCNDEYVSSVEEIEKIFSSARRDVDVNIVFTQAKTSESWDKHEINVFESALLDFISEDRQYPYSQYLLDVRSMIDVLFSNIGKISGGRPSVECLFATSAPDTLPREIEAARNSIYKKVKSTDYFKNVDVRFIGRTAVSDLWSDATGGTEASFTVGGMAPFPAIPSVDMSYVVTMKAHDFVVNVLADKDVKLKHNIFDENVRDYIGDDNYVNQSMFRTIADVNKRDLFWNIK